MTAGPSTGLTNPVTLTVKKGASTASLSFKRYDDGTLEFVKTNGVATRYSGSNIGLKAIFDAIQALV